MTNPLLGKRISLVSKKNIRYEGVLYSINEQNATVALQNVKTFGTEGREAAEGCIFVAPTDTVHPYLLFRGQDIKDLHVHEQTAEEENKNEGIQQEKPAAAVALTPAPAEKTLTPVVQQPKPPVQAKTDAKPQQQQPPAQTNKPQDSGRGSSTNRRTRNNNNNKAAPGTGASLLNRTARGVVGSSTKTPQEDFDFQSSLEKFKGKNDEPGSNNNNDNNPGAAYEKDDFFDSISCDALDKQYNNRLKGADERRLNTETFGAVALNTQSRRRAGGGRGGRGRDGGRVGRGRGGRGRGRGRSFSTGSE